MGTRTRPGKGSAGPHREDHAGLTPGWALGWLVHLAGAQHQFLVSVPLSHCVVWGTSCTQACLASPHLRQESSFSLALFRNDSGLRNSTETHAYSHYFGSALREKEKAGLVCETPAGSACCCLWAELASGWRKPPRHIQQGPPDEVVASPTPSAALD